MKVYIAFCIIILMLCSLGGCGNDSDWHDHSGLVCGSDDKLLFARGSQEYFRGRLSDAKSTFEGVIAEYPESALVCDAELAVRRINADLSEHPLAVTAESVSANQVVVQQRLPSIAIVSNSGASDAANKLRNAFVLRGSTPLIKEDPGAADFTLVLYPGGMSAQAQQVADTLTAWISTLSSVSTQQADDVISSIFPGHSGVLIIVGSDISTAYIDD